MQELKQIIIARINDIKQLEGLQSQSNINSKNRYQAILKQKFGQELRTKRENQIMTICINQANFPSHEELFGFVKFICSLYDPYLDINGESDLKNRIYLLLKSFFYKHDYRQKMATLKSVFGRNSIKFYALPVVNLLSQWSKKRYLKILNIELKAMKEQFIYKTLDCQSASRLQKTKQSTPFESQKRFTNKISAMRSEINITQRPQKKKKGSQASINSGKILTLYNRATLYSYFSGQLDQYYQITGIQDLDIPYVKSLNKRKMKQNLHLPENINRAISILIDCSWNKQIKNLINSWIQRIDQYKMSERCRIRRSQNVTKNTRKSNDSEIKQKKKLSLDMKTSQIYQTPQKSYQLSNSNHNRMNTSILLGNPYEKDKVFQSMRKIAQKQSFNKIRYKKPEKLEEQNDQGTKIISKIKLPSLSKSMEKQEKNFRVIQKTKIMRFSTQQQMQENQQSQIKHLPRFKLIQRQTIKGIIIRNFLSNRERIIKKNLNKKVQCKSARKQKEDLSNDQKKNSNDTEHKKITECVDIRSLRQKTKALLRNFNTLQNYLD